MSGEQSVMDNKRLQRPWDVVGVQRWQLDRLLNGLVEITSELDAATGADRLRMAAAAGFASGMAIALRMLVESMRQEAVK